jgi:nitrite reductase/ring-hydroxylating ferredoxin subunit
MPDTILHHPAVASPMDWSGDMTRVPFWVYRDRALVRTEQERVFEGPVWNFLCLEDEIANPGDWRATVDGQMPVVVARDGEGEIATFENRCAHRGALICLDNAGRGAQDFQCVYHAWRYDLRGNLKSVAFRRGVNGKGGMPPEFRADCAPQHAPSENPPNQRRFQAPRPPRSPLRCTPSPRRNLSRPYARAGGTGKLSDRQETIRRRRGYCGEPRSSGLCRGD